MTVRIVFTRVDPVRQLVPPDVYSSGASNRWMARGERRRGDDAASRAMNAGVGGGAADDGMDGDAGRVDKRTLAPSFGWRSYYCGAVRRSVSCSILPNNNGHP